MAYRIIWSSKARRQLKAIETYIADDSEQYARIVKDRLIGATKRLADFPFSGRRVPQAPGSGLREVIVYSYRIMYRVEDDRVEIVTIIHSRQDFPRRHRRKE